MRFAATAAVLCALALPVGPALSQPAASGAMPLPQLLARMRAVNGGLWNAHIVSTSPHELDGAAAILHTDVQGLRYVVTQCSGRVCVGTYFDGLHVFSVNINGTALPHPPPAGEEAFLRSLRILGTLDFLSPQFTSSGGRIDDGGWTTFQGRRCRRIYVSETYAVPMEVFIDPQSGLVQGAADVNGDATYLMRDYRRVGAFQLPFEIDKNGTPIEHYITRKTVDDPFEPPHGLHAFISQTPAGMALDPQSTTPQGTCSIGGQPVHCLIDTGNSALSMSLELAEQLRLDPIGMMHIAGLGQYATEVVRAGPLQLGNVRFGDANYVVLSDIHRFGYDLVIGADVLASMPITIDYARHALYFGGDTQADLAGTTVPLAFQNFVPVVSVTLGNVPAQLAVDTGDQSNINLGYEYYQQHPTLFHPTRRESVTGVGGQSIELIGEIGTVRIGTMTAENQQIGTTQTLRGTANGHLGAGFLSKYRVTLDYARKLLRLLPKS
jgi:hypothetical protein